MKLIAPEILLANYFASNLHSDEVPYTKLRELKEKIEKIDNEIYIDITRDALDYVKNVYPYFEPDTISVGCKEDNSLLRVEWANMFNQGLDDVAKSAFNKILPIKTPDPVTFPEILQEINEINQIETKELPVKIMKFNEEFGEFSAEALKMLGHTYKEYDEKELKSEMADALQCLISVYLDICQKQNISFDDILNEIKVNNKKWKTKIKDYKKKSSKIISLQTLQYQIVNI